MKKISKVTLESMRKELFVLETDKLSSIKGGYYRNDWGCLFDCLELMNKQQGCNNRDAQSYYNEYIDTTSYGGTAYDPRNNQGVGLNFANGFTGSDSPQFGNYPAVKDGGLEEMLYDLTKNNNSVLMAIESNTPNVGHFVVGSSATTVRDKNGNITDIYIVYDDPSQNKSGTISVKDVKGFWKVQMNCDTGNLDDTGNMY